MTQDNPRTGLENVLTRGLTMEAAQKNCLLFFDKGKLVLAHSTERTYPIIGNIGKWGTGGDSMFWISDRRVIDPIANFAYVFFHNLKIKGLSIVY